MSVPTWWKKPRQVTIVVDNESWVLPYASRLSDEVREAGDDAFLVRRYEDVREGDVAFYLGCTGIASATTLARNHRNLVVHASDLPKGRGFSPLVWQILAGENNIPVCLIEAALEVDSGPVIYKEWVLFEGHELNDELRSAIGEMHLTLCRRFLGEATPPKGKPQTGEVTTYPRRRPNDSRLDPTKAIAEQFNLLRTVDNDRYPAFFTWQGHDYVLRIDKRSRKEVK